MNKYQFDPLPESSVKLEAEIIREICRAYGERGYGDPLRVEPREA